MVGWILFSVGTGLFCIGFVLPFTQSAIERRWFSGDVGRSRSLVGASPTIEVIVPAYLEHTVIGPTIARLRDSLQPYSGSHRITVVASDPQTALAATAADRVITAPRAGKASATNLGVRGSDADIIVLTDANCEVHPVEWPGITVEALSNWDLVSANKSEHGGAERGFWAYERAIKDKMSSSVGTVSVVGEFMAMRRSDYRDIPVGTICDDLWLATDFVERGLRTGIVGRLATVEPPATAVDQWERRVRIAEGVFVEQAPRLTVLLRTGPGRLFVAHKLYRLTVGCLGFWLAVLGLSLVAPPWSLAIGLVTLVVVLMYSGAVVAPTWLVAAVSPIGMQGVRLLPWSEF